MRKLSQQTAPGKCQVSALRKCLKRPETYLIALAFMVVVSLADACRRPDKQVSAKLYIAGVRCYQAYARPLLKRRIQCRYDPSCSQYSIEAVQRHGLGPGLGLTLRRVSSCRTTVPVHTPDPVPD